RGHPPYPHSGAHHFTGTDRRVFEESSTRHRRPRSSGTRAVKSRSIFASTRKAVRVQNSPCRRPENNDIGPPSASVAGFMYCQLNVSITPLITFMARLRPGLGSGLSLNF